MLCRKGEWIGTMGSFGYVRAWCVRAVRATPTYSLNHS
jgi:hypothetical protein